MGKNDAPETPSKPNSVYKIGDRDVANAYWNGNDYVTRYNPTAQETQSMNYLQSAIPQAYADATNSNGINGYKQNWINNQTKQFNELADTNLTRLKDNLITGGQVGSSTGWNKIKDFVDSYNDTLADISTNADLEALNYQNSLLNYANNLQNSMNNYYNLASSNSQNTANNQNIAWNQNVQDYQNQLAAWQAEKNANNSLIGNIWGGLQTVGSLALTPYTAKTYANALAKKTGAI